jgi:hypothetical protein
MGLLNFLPDDPNKKEAMRAGLLNLGAAMLSGRGNFGNMLGQGLGAGVQGYQGALAGQQQKQLSDAQLERWNLENQQTKAAIAEPGVIASILHPDAAPQQPSAASALSGGATVPNVQPQGSNGVLPLSALPQAGAQASASPPVAPPMSQYATLMGYGDKLSAAGKDGAAKKYYDMAKSVQQKYATDFRVAQGADGKLHNFMVAEDGSIKDTGLGVKPEMVETDLGGKKVWNDKNTMQPGASFTKTITPGEALQSADQRQSRAQSERHWQADQVAGAPMAQVSNGLAGNDFLGSLDAPTAAQVKGLAEGRLAFPAGKALQSPYWQKMINAVAQYDPSFDAVNYGARAKTRGDFVAGKSADNIKSINTAIAHMGQLNDQLTDLHNTSSPTVNTVKNWLGTHTGNSSMQTRIAAAGATAEGVAGEMAKVFRSTGMSEHEINAWREKFSSSTTPGQQKGTMQSAMHMLQGRMEALNDQYKTGMGTTAQPLDILTPQSKKVFSNLFGSSSHDAPTQTPQQQQAPKAAQPPAPGTAKGGYVFKGGNPADKANWVKQ